MLHGTLQAFHHRKQQFHRETVFSHDLRKIMPGCNVPANAELSVNGLPVTRQDPGNSISETHLQRIAKPVLLLIGVTADLYPIQFSLITKFHPIHPCPFANFLRLFALLRKEAGASVLLFTVISNSMASIPASRLMFPRILTLAFCPEEDMSACSFPTGRGCCSLRLCHRCRAFSPSPPSDTPVSAHSQAAAVYQLT